MLSSISIKHAYVPILSILCISNVCTASSSSSTPAAFTPDIMTNLDSPDLETRAKALKQAAIFVRSTDPVTAIDYNALAQAAEKNINNENEDLCANALTLYMLLAQKKAIPNYTVFFETIGSKLDHPNAEARKSILALWTIIIQQEKQGETDYKALCQAALANINDSNDSVRASALGLYALLVSRKKMENIDYPVILKAIKTSLLSSNEQLKKVAWGLWGILALEKN